MLANFKKLLLDALFPDFCVNCRKEGSPLCYDCASAVSINTAPGPSFTNNQLNGLFYGCSYQEKIVQKTIRAFKYAPYIKTLSQPLAFLIISHIELSENKGFFKNGENSILLPIPISEKKQKQRGFNQSELLANYLSRFLQMPTLKNVLIKIKETKPQAELSQKERQKNIRGAFRVKKPSAVKNKRVFLVDDVYTTGATMNQAAMALKHRGVKEVFGIVVAREPLV